MTDDPTAARDGMDPGDDDQRPPAPRYHGGVHDPAHPDFFTTEHRDLAQAPDLRGSAERALVVDDHASQTAGPGAATQAQVGGQPPVPGSTDAGDPRDPRHARPDADPSST